MCCLRVTSLYLLKGMRTLSFEGCLGCTGWDLSTVSGAYCINFFTFQRASLQAFAPSCRVASSVWAVPRIWSSSRPGIIPYSDPVSWQLPEPLERPWKLSEAVFCAVMAFTTPSLTRSRGYGAENHLTLKTSLGLFLGLSQIHVRNNPDDQSLETGAVLDDAVTPNSLKGAKNFGEKAQTARHYWQQAQSWAFAWPIFYLY